MIYILGSNVLLTFTLILIFPAVYQEPGTAAKQNPNTVPKSTPENSETALRALQGLSALLRLKLAHLNGDKTLSDKTLKA